MNAAGGSGGQGLKNLSPISRAAGLLLKVAGGMEGLKEAGSVNTSVLCDRGRGSRVFVTEAR